MKVLYSLASLRMSLSLACLTHLSSTTQTRSKVSSQSMLWTVVRVLFCRRCFYAIKYWPLPESKELSSKQANFSETWSASTQRSSSPSKLWSSIWPHSWNTFLSATIHLNLPWSRFSMKNSCPSEKTKSGKHASYSTKLKCKESWPITRA